MNPLLPETGTYRAEGLLLVSGHLTPYAYIASSIRQLPFSATLAVAQLRSQSASTALGSLWHLLNPALTAGIYFLVFDLILGFGSGFEHFWMYLTVGVIGFTYISRLGSISAAALPASGNLVRQLPPPRIAVIVAHSLRELFDSALGIAIILVVALLVGSTTLARSLLLVPALMLLAAFATGVGLALARLGAQLRDAPHITSTAMQLWLYLSGVFYLPTLVENRVQDMQGWLGSLLLGAFHYNPGFLIIQVLRQAFLENVAVSPLDWGVALSWSLFSLAAGMEVFRRGEDRYGAL